MAKRDNPQGFAIKVRAFLARVTVLPWTEEAAAAYGELRAGREAGGVTLAPMDVMIAAHAKALAENQTILVTGDGAFSRAAIPRGLTLEDWTKEISS